MAPHTGGMAAVEVHERDPYRVLGVARTASTDEIAAAFRARAKELHPDRRPGDALALERFKRLTMAYRTLRSPGTRAELARQSSGAAPRPGPRARPTSSPPLFATERRARLAIWAGAGLAVLGIAGAVALGMLRTGDTGKTVTLWIADAKFLVCGPILAGLGLHRLRRFRGGQGRPGRRTLA